MSPGGREFEDNVLPSHSVKPAILLPDSDHAAKAVGGEPIAKLGCEPFDVGGLDQACQLERMTHFAIHGVRVHGHSPRVVRAVLKG
jgi:predicted dinucleotide-binding enzyme